MKIILSVAITLISLLAMAADTVPNYKYWDLGASQKRDEYQYMLLKLLLERTKSSYGPYHLEKYTDHLASSRSVRELERGELINVIALPTPIWGVEDIKSKSSIVVPRSLLKGLLGYRQLVVRKSDLPTFEKIHTQDQLRELTLGQGRDWEDINVYKYNHYKVVDSADFLNLFAMLKAGRFDYLPLSVLEAKEMLDRFDGQSQQLAIVPDLVLYYPFPVLYNISVNHPELVKRIEDGIEMVDKDGSLDELFNQYFSTSIADLTSHPMRVAVLKTPSTMTHMGLDEPTLLMTGKFKPNLLK